MTHIGIRKLRCAVGRGRNPLHPKERSVPKDVFQVDAFADRPLFGNPAAVVFDADDLSTEMMQKIAQETNLSETVFLCRPTVAEADYRLRIFTPRSELPFAGHPTIAAAHAFLSRDETRRGQKLLRQECGIGIVPIEIRDGAEGRVLWMTQASPTFRDVDLPRSVLAGMLGCGEAELADSPAQVVSTGVPWLLIPVREVATVARLSPDQSLIACESEKIGATGATAFAEHDRSSPVRVRVRTFAPGEGISEDPVCGAGNGAIAAYIAQHRDTTEPRGAYRAEQGIEIGRNGTVHVAWERKNGSIEVKVGGQAATVMEGRLLV